MAAQPSAKKLKKAIIYPTDEDTAATLKQRGFARVEDYGSYLVVQGTDAQMDEFRKARGNRLVNADHFDKIELASATIDTTQGEPAIDARMLDRSPAGHGLKLVQFRGPITTEWLDQLKSAGQVRVISYIPNNAYLVKLNAKAEQELQKLIGGDGPIQWIGRFHPQYKLGAGLQNAAGVIDVKVAVMNDDEDTATTIDAVGRYAVVPPTSRVNALKQTIIRVRLSGTDLAAVAALPNVLWIQQDVPVKKLDEVQALTMANRTNSPSGGPIFPADRYLDFLVNEVGFSQNPFDYPILDITDTGLDGFSQINAGACGSAYPWHPSFCLPAATVSPGAHYFPYNPFVYINRVAYSYATSDTEGHGTTVASVAAGFDLLPDEVIHCYTQKITNKCTTNNVVVFQCVTNSFTVDCNSLTCPTYPPQCCTNFLFTCSFVTNTTVTCTNSCEVVIDTSAPPPWYISRRDYDGYQLGLGVSPFGRIGASSYTTAFNDPEFVARNAYYRGARISNNSWGEVPVIHVNDGVYDDLSASYDALTRDAWTTGDPSIPGPSPLNQEIFFVFAGGNAGASQPVGFGDVLVTPPATAKNVLSVGSTAGASQMSTFSSFGPCRDGRFKPDVVAPGEGITGAFSQDAYTHPLCGGCDPNDPVPFACEQGFFTHSIMSQVYNEIPAELPTWTLHKGTSFSAPAASGSAQLLWWYIVDRYPMLAPTPAMMKGYICNSARYLPITNPLTGATDTLPSTAQGMGAIDLARMFDGVPRVLRDQSSPRAIDIALVLTNPVMQQTYFTKIKQSYEVSGQIADATKPFRVTLTWSDAPGNPVVRNALVNNLDLEVSVSGKTYRGNVFVGGNSADITVPVSWNFPDTLNNMESVFVPAGQTGQWSVVVRAINLPGNGVPNVGDVTNNQDFALVVYNGNTPSDAAATTTNDACQSAINLTAFPFHWTNSLVGNTYHNNHPSPTAGRGGVEEFFKIVNPTPGTGFSANTFGSNFDTLLSIWKGGCGALEEVVSSDNVSNTFQSAVNWTVTDTNTFYIVVEGRSNKRGTVVLNVTATPPPFSFSTALLDFGSVYVGASSEKSGTLNNGTTSSVTVNGMSITGTNAGDFQITAENCTDNYLSPGSGCQYFIKFSPTAGGVRTAQLVVDDTVTGSPHILPLTGFGLAPTPFACASAVSLNFGAVGVGLTSTVQSVVFTNCGTADLVISNAIIAGLAPFDFDPGVNTCSGQTIPVGGTCTIDLAFTPTTNGTRSASLIIYDNTPETQHSVSLTGNGLARLPAVCLAPSTVSFGNVLQGSLSLVKSVIVSNCGLAALNITSVALTGAGAGEFSISSDACSGGSIPVGGTCLIGVQFAPTVLGVANATLQIVDSAAGSPHLVNLVGNGAGSQPDASIDRKLKNKKPSIGVDIYTPPTAITSQTLTQRAKRGKPRTFYVRCQNDGNSPDTFTVAGGADVPGVLAVKYFLGSGSSALDITAAVKAGTYAAASLEAGAITSDSTLIQVQITPDQAAPAGTNGVTISFQSTSNVAKVDAVRAAVEVR
ncbi:MAG: choice-of-anchor D domain-containing protein [Verrucomicrobiota bacterium]